MRSPSVSGVPKLFHYMETSLVTCSLLQYWDCFIHLNSPTLFAGQGKIPGENAVDHHTLLLWHWVLLSVLFLYMLPVTIDNHRSTSEQPDRNTSPLWEAGSFLILIFSYVRRKKLEFLWAWWAWLHYELFYRKGADPAHSIPLVSAGWAVGSKFKYSGCCCTSSSFAYS